MNLHNEIDNDACSVRVCEIQDRLGESDLPSTRAPLNIPAGIDMRLPMLKGSRRRVADANRDIRWDNKDRKPFGVRDRYFVQESARVVREGLLAETYYTETFDSADGSYSPEDAMIDAIDNANEPRGDMHPWRLREEYVKGDPRGDMETEPLHRLRPRVVTTTVHRVTQDRISKETERLYAMWQYRGLSCGEIRRIAESGCRALERRVVQITYVPDRSTPEPQDAEEQSEARLLSQECRRRGNEQLWSATAWHTDNDRQRTRRIGGQSLRHILFDDWSNYFVEEDALYLELEMLREIDDLEEQDFQDWCEYEELEELMEEIRTSDQLEEYDTEKALQDLFEALDGGVAA